MEEERSWKGGYRGRLTGGISPTEAKRGMSSFSCEFVASYDSPWRRETVATTTVLLEFLHRSIKKARLDEQHRSRHQRVLYALKLCTARPRRGLHDHAVD